MTFQISIDRQARKWAVFDDASNCVKAFDSYVEEAQALSAGRAFVAERTAIEPEVVYPFVKRVVMKS